MLCLLVLSLPIVCERWTLTNSYIPGLSHRADPMQVFTLKQEFGESADAVDYACMKKWKVWKRQETESECKRDVVWPFAYIHVRV